MTETDATLLEVPSAESTRVTVEAGVDLHVVRAGSPDDPLVVLLHGFPDFWYGWRHQLPALVGAGFRVLVPDQRGYNLSDKPRGLAAYRRGRLAADVVALVESEDRESAHVVGHDWGGGVGWDLALRHPGVVERLAVCNAPHPTVFLRTARSNPRQFLRSAYVLFYQLPGVPEWLLGREGGVGIRWTLEASSSPGAFSPADLDTYQRAYAHEGAVRGAVNWYRAAARRPDDPPRERVAAPTLVVWGEDDDALVNEMAAESLAFCADGRLERFPGASHWVHVEEPERVNELLVDHLAG